MDEPPDRSPFLRAELCMGITVSTLFRQNRMRVLRSLVDAAEKGPSDCQLC